MQTREDLIKHLLATGIAGAVATPRENNLLHYRLLAERDSYYMLGLDPGPQWTFDAILGLMADKAGVSARLNHRSGQDTIDPELTVAALDRYAEHLAAAARERRRVLLATGHPGSLLSLYQLFAAVLRAAGCTVLEAGAGWSYEAPVGTGHRKQTIRYYDGVGMMHQGGSLVHTHSSRPIQAALNDLAARGQEPPGLVLADHGWCGGAGRAGIPAIGFADSNDPALFVGEAEGAVAVSVPLDDGMAPQDYLLLAAYVLQRAGIEQAHE